MFVDVSNRPGKTIRLVFEGREVRVRTGLSIAAGLLEAGVSHFRDAPVTDSPRAAFCMMGVCFDCLVVVDGVANCQACMIEARPGMRINRQSGEGGVLPGSEAAWEGK